MKVFYTSPWIPAEWIRAYGLEPRGIWSLEETSANPLPLSGGVCAFAETALRYADTHPDSAVIFTTACDQMRRSFDAVAAAGRSRVFLFNLPATQTAVAGRLFRSELERLGRFFESLGGCAPSGGRLADVMRQYSERRIQLAQSGQGCTARQYAEAATRFHENGPVELPRGAGQPEVAIPLAIIGGPLPSSQQKILDVIATAGGLVVLNGTEPGERTLGPIYPQAGTAADPLDTLSRCWFESIVDVFQRPNTRLYDWLRPRIQSRRVRGIVLWHFTGCDLWRAEAQSLREAFGLPVLPLDADEVRSNSPRETGRLQAFVETLK
jgi:benzoyl-CoA reductase/2-hydroxyglutaryl-CoA dehydratase subunit BcrC/BadD/HgdB